jgi:hypothetical protein
LIFIPYRKCCSLLFDILRGFYSTHLEKGVVCYAGAIPAFRASGAHITFVHQEGRVGRTNPSRKSQHNKPAIPLHRDTRTPGARYQAARYRALVQMNGEGSRVRPFHSRSEFPSSSASIEGRRYLLSYII